MLLKTNRMSPEQSLTSFVTELTPSLSSFLYARAIRHTKVSGERPAGRQLVDALTLSRGCDNTPLGQDGEHNRRNPGWPGSVVPNLG
jgi:hypothetical protein